MGEIATKVLVLGGGPGGYVAAIRAGQHHLDTVLVEDMRLGGTCLNVGCIPSKALIHAAEAYSDAQRQAAGARFGLRIERPSLDFGKMMAWKDDLVARLNAGVAALLKRSRVKIVRGRGTMLDGKTCRIDTETGPETVRAEHVVLATGSVAAALPSLPFGGRVISSTEALSLAEAPATLGVVGAGYIGLELGMAFAKLGTKVTVVEAAERILPLYDAELTHPVSRSLQALGVETMVHAKAVGLSHAGDVLLVETRDGSREVAAGKILVAVGRRPRTNGWGLERLDLP
jgi:dihydrolipoamide dehydrogenase